VPLDGDTVAAVIENYMLRSEQLDTKLWLAADEHVARGLLLQKLPKEGGIATAAQHDVEAWNHVVTLGSTVKKDELLSTDIQTMMRRLFWEETIRLFDPTHPSFHCTCSREKVGGMLKILGKEEVDSALADLGSLSINCDFCGQHYEFDAVDCAQLFVSDASADGATKPPGETRH
jgi:molecular chaperone Hsp33